MKDLADLPAIEGTAIGRVSLLGSVEHGRIMAAALADCFEEDDERYPVFDVLDMIEHLVSQEIWDSQSSSPKLDDETAAALTSFANRIMSLVGQYPVITPERKAEIKSICERGDQP